ncbi:MAG: hypothetical protein P8Y00_10500, partial [Deltaproteobacteria bacterium]
EGHFTAALRYPESFLNQFQSCSGVCSSEALCFTGGATQSNAYNQLKEIYKVSISLIEESPMFVVFSSTHHWPTSCFI